MRVFWIIFGAVCVIAGIIGLFYLKGNTPSGHQQYKIIRNSSISGIVFGILIILMDIILFA